MPNEINPVVYDTIQNLYANAIDQLDGVTDYYRLAAYEVVMLQVFAPELDLLNPLYNTWQSTEAYYDTTPNTVITSVRTLQKHVMNRARQGDGTRYASISAWIIVQQDSGTGPLGPIRQSFAEISAQAGYTLTGVATTP